MNFFDLPFLSSIIFSPLLGIFLLLFVHNRGEILAKSIALISTSLTFILSIILFFLFDPKKNGFQFSEKLPWIPEFSVDYQVGLDGISLFFFLLTSFLCFCFVLGGWKTINRKSSYLCGIILWIEIFTLGIFASTNAFLVSVFLGIQFLPFFFLVGLWSPKKRIRDVLQFTIPYLLHFFLFITGIAFIALLHKESFGVMSFQIEDWYKLSFSKEVQVQLFFIFLVSFLCILPVLPFHHWFFTIGIQAPTIITTILFALFSKIGIYGIIRFILPLFPYATEEYANYVILLSLVGAIYPSILMLRQNHFKTLIILYSTLSVAFTIFGLFSLDGRSLQGAIYHTISHGILVAGLFFGMAILQDRQPSEEISNFRGLIQKTPMFSLAFILILLGAVGFPGMSSFLGMFLILSGSFHTLPVQSILILIAVLIMGTHFVSLIHRVFIRFAKKPDLIQMWRDLSLREALLLSMIIFLIIGIGLYPNLIFSRMQESVTEILDKIYSPDKITLHLTNQIRIK
ncbi:MAG: NADH-quinone oxidoreductase subunit M [bacterium]|jgi:NADH-quinone oxidoreductase subunit M